MSCVYKGEEEKIMNKSEHMTATKLAIQNKEYWDNFNYLYEYQEMDRFLSPLMDILYLGAIRRHYINEYFAKWGWK